jgi:Carboxypeptidase regulatory-like domain/TonB dependent receptor
LRFSFGWAIRCLFVVMLFVLSPFSRGQSVQSSILGTVKDQTGAVVTNAKVVITNVEKGISLSYRTNSVGDYQALELAPGTYNVKVAKSNFQTQLIAGVALEARAELRIDVTLTVGAEQQEITVQGSAAGVVETETASISAALDSASVSNLPVNYYGSSGTSPLNVIQVLPGVQSDTAPGSTTPSASGAPTMNFSVQGGMPFQTEVSVDGISTTNVRSNSPLSDAFPSAESIAEMRVDGVLNNAEFGQAGEITTISKSGTEKVHGSVFWHYQNDALDATPYGELIKPKKNGNDFGVSVGGPVVIPHIFNGRNRTFFFGTYEGFRFPKQTALQELVPTTAMMQGDFSQEYPIPGMLIDPNSAEGPIPYAAENDTGTNVIPTSMINPSGNPFMQFFPAPNYPFNSPYQTLGDALSGTGYNYSVNAPNDYNSNQFDARIDHNLNRNMLAFVRYTGKSVTLLSPQSLKVPTLTNFDNYHILASSFVYTITPNLINDFLFGFTWEQNGQRNQLDGSSYTKAANFTPIGPGLPADGVTVLAFGASTIQEPGDLTWLWAGNYNQTTNSHLLQYNDSLTWTKGQHTFKFGGDIRQQGTRSTLGNNTTDNVEAFLFSGNYTSLFGQLPGYGFPATNNQTAYQFADFMSGNPTATEYYTLIPYNEGKTFYYSGYAQDQWKAAQNLVVSYGVRYEYHPAYQDTQGAIGNFDPSLPGTGRVIYPSNGAGLLNSPFLESADVCGYGPSSTPNAACTPIETNVQAGLPAGLRNSPKDRILPRVGLAWRPFGNDKTSIRSGFGVYNTTLAGSSYFSMTGALQQVQSTIYNLNPPNYYPSLYTWPNIAPPGGLATNYGSAQFNAGNELNWKDPYSMQWSLSVDHQWMGEIGTRLSYIGMRTDELVWGAALNEMPFSSTTPASERPLTDRPFPNWGAIQDRYTGAHALYNGMQLEAMRNFSKGLSFQSTYTWSKNLADNQGPATSSFTNEDGGGDSGYASYYRNLRLDYGNVYGTRRQRWITTGLFSLPVGRGKTMGHDMNRATDAVLGNWQLSSIFLIQTGPYLSAFIPGGDADPSGTGSGDNSLYGMEQHPDQVGPIKPHNQNRNEWVNPLAFACPSNTGYTSASYAGNPCGVGVTSNPIGRFGTEHTGAIEGPGTVNLSAGLSKTVNFGDDLHLRIEGSFTNVLNHTNLNDPILDITSPLFGTIKQARGSDFGGSRTGQVSAKLMF